MELRDQVQSVIPVPERQPGDYKHAEVRRGPDASQLQHDEAFEPRLVSRIKAWAGEDKKRLRARSL
jgi:hypothetical protein